MNNILTAKLTSSFRLNWSQTLVLVSHVSLLLILNYASFLLPYCELCTNLSHSGLYKSFYSPWSDYFLKSSLGKISFPFPSKLFYSSLFGVWTPQRALLLSCLSSHIPVFLHHSFLVLIFCILSFSATCVSRMILWCFYLFSCWHCCGKSFMLLYCQ